jgi:hypothetical protein
MTDGFVPPVPFDGSQTRCHLNTVKNALPFEEMIDTNRISAYNISAYNNR